MKYAFVVVCACLGVVLGTTSVAHADRPNAGFEFKTGPSFTWIPKMPTMTSPDSLEVGPRTLASQDVRVGGSMAGFGWNILDIGYVFGDHWEVPLFGVSLYGAVGSYDRVRTSVDGSLAMVRPWSAFAADILFPGFGYRVKRRRWLFSATARLGASIVTENGSIAAGSETVDLSLFAGTMAVYGELEACRRIDPLSRACLVIAPRIVGFGVMNGGTIGIRMELGR